MGYLDIAIMQYHANMSMVFFAVLFIREAVMSQLKLVSTSKN